MQKTIYIKDEEVALWNDMKDKAAAIGISVSEYLIRGVVGKPESDNESGEGPPNQFERIMNGISDLRNSLDSLIRDRKERIIEPPIIGNLAKRDFKSEQPDDVTEQPENKLCEHCDKVHDPRVACPEYQKSQMADPFHRDNIDKWTKESTTPTVGDVEIDPAFYDHNPMGVEIPVEIIREGEPVLKGIIVEPGSIEQFSDEILRQEAHHTAKILKAEGQAKLDAARKGRSIKKDKIAKVKAIQFNPNPKGTGKKRKAK
jgi:hypothetical protein